MRPDCLSMQRAILKVVKPLAAPLALLCQQVQRYYDPLHLR